MPQPCDISTCDSTSLAACFCCNQYLCRDHFIEHDHLLRSKLNDLTGQINELTNQLEIFDTKNVSSDFLLILDQWRLNSYKIIDRFYEKKCEELNHYIREILNKQEKEVNDVRLKIAKMINVQQTTNTNINLLISNIKTLQEQMKQIENISIEIDVSSLVIDDSLIEIDIPDPYQSNLSTLSPPYEIIERVPLSSDAMASNSQYLLSHQNSSLFLIDKFLCIIGEKKWPYDWIRDMCWSQVLNSFFIITSSNVYLVDGDSLAIEHLKSIKGKFWQSCTCSDTSLYLSKDTWNSAIDEFDLKSSLKFVKHCSRIEVMKFKQRIDSIEYSNETLALAINDQSTEGFCLELRSTGTFDLLWSCRLDIDYSQRKIQCCLINQDTWMVADWGTSSLFYITKDGKLKNRIEYKYELHHVNLFGTNKLVISTNDSIHFHKL
jgi:hypothetical protein